MGYNARARMTNFARFPFVGLSFLALVTLVLACSSGGGKPAGNDGGCPTGSETCACYANATCNQGLTCASEICVNLGAGGSGGAGAQAGAGGSAAGAGGGGATGSGDSGGHGGSSGTGGATGSGGAGGSAGGNAGAGAGGSAGGSAGTGAGGAGGGAGGTGAGGSAGTGGTAAGGSGAGGGGAGGAAVNNGHTFNFAPSIASRGSTLLDVFGVGSDFHGYVRSWNGTSWGSWTSADGGSGVFTSRFDAASWGPTRLDLFALGSTSDVFHSDSTSGTAISPAWEDLSPGMPFTQGVGATSPGTNLLWVFSTGTNISLWGRYYNGTAWGTWTNLGGGLLGFPDATSSGGNVWVVTRGAGNQLWTIKLASGATTWGSFVQLPSLSGGAGFAYPACIAARSATALDVYAVGGSNNDLWHNSSADGGATWQLPTWENWGGGPFTSAPDCIARSASQIDIVALKADGHVWHEGWAGSVSAWDDLGVY